MKSLLTVLLIHYYARVKRIIPRYLSRRIDADIKLFCSSSETTAKLVGEARIRARQEVATVKMRSKSPRPIAVSQSLPNVQHVPCGSSKKR